MIRTTLSEVRVRELQAAALRVITRKGLDGATMQEIADEAQVAKGTLYLYFKDRNDLLERAADYAFEQLQARLQQTLPGLPSFADKLRGLIQAEIEFFDEHREFFRIYLALKHRPEELHQSARRQRQCHPRYAAHLQRIEVLLREAMARGEVRPCDPARLALFVSETAVALMLRRLTEDHPPSAETDGAWMVDILLNGLATKGNCS